MENTQFSLDDLLYLMARLRNPEDGCPWDIVQSYQSIAPSTLEEAYEVVDAIERNDPRQLKEELGDLLFQVVFYSQLGHEQNVFDFAEIVSAITRKLLRRHPHVFPDGTLTSRAGEGGHLESNSAANSDADEDHSAQQAAVKRSWESIKQAEREQKGQHGLLDDIPSTFPAMVRAVKLQKRAASIGFDWANSEGVYAKLEEEIAELKEAQASGVSNNIEDELGDVLFTVANLARHLKVDPETALRKANRKFEQRFRTMESHFDGVKADFSSFSEDELEARWQKAKDQLANH